MINLLTGSAADEELLQTDHEDIQDLHQGGETILRTQPDSFGHGLAGTLVQVGLQTGTSAAVAH